MKGKFENSINKFPGWLDLLIKSDLIPREKLSHVPDRGIYVYYDIEDHLPIYVGRSDRMRTRLQEHSRPSSGHTSATFAYILAREKWDKIHEGDKRTRKEIESDNEFSKIYTEKKNEVSLLKVRALSIEDPVEQALFEIYAAEELETRYNFWENH